MSYRDDRLGWKPVILDAPACSRQAVFYSRAPSAIGISRWICRSGNVHIAYQIAGSSDLDMVLVPDLFTTWKVGGNCRQPPTSWDG